MEYSSKPQFKVRLCISTTASVMDAIMAAGPSQTHKSRANQEVAFFDVVQRHCLVRHDWPIAQN